MPRNGSGTYTLPTGNPVVTGTTIESSWANNTLGDIGNEITNSLSRSGAGGMTGALRITDGVSTVPGLAWSNETGTGFYRAGTGDTRLVVQTAGIQKWTASGTEVTGALSASGATTLSSTLNVSGNVSLDGGSFTFNESGADKDARFEGDTDANLLFTDASTDRVGIGTATPTAKLHVVGDATVSGTVNATTLDLTNLEVTNIKAKDGTASMTLADSTGVASFSANPVFSGGTANGVLYLNASKVATSGSALVFDGNNLGVGSAPATKLDVSGSAPIARVLGNSGTVPQLQLSSGGVVAWSLRANNDGASDFTIYQDSTQRLKIDSSGNLGIGTSSPATKLHVNTGAAGYGITVAALSQTSRTYQLGIDSNSNFAIYESVAAAQRVVLDQSGNLGLGVTPSAWNADYKAIQVGANGSIAGRVGTSNSFDVSTNTYRDNVTGDWRYIASSGVSRYSLDGSTSAHIWYTAPSGTAGNAISFTQAMTLDASGNLGVGTTSPSSIGSSITTVDVSGAAGGGVRFQRTSAATTSGYIVALSGEFRVATADTNPLTLFTNNQERARITSGGDLLVGKTAQNVAAVGTEIISTGTNRSSVADSTNASSTYEVYSTTALAYRFYVGLAGTIYATNTTITAISDQRLKENIRDLDAGLSEIMALKPRKFDWKAGKGKDIKGDRGWIAQEFEQVFPDLIDDWKDPAPEGEEPYKSVRADLIPVLVKAIQEQQALITDLTARVAALEAQP